MATSPTLDAVRPVERTTAASDGAMHTDTPIEVSPDEERLMALMEAVCGYYVNCPLMSMSEDMHAVLHTGGSILNADGDCHAAFVQLAQVTRRDGLHRHSRSVAKAVQG